VEDVVELGGIVDEEVVWLNTKKRKEAALYEQAHSLPSPFCEVCSLPHYDVVPTSWQRRLMDPEPFCDHFC
jgi:hypothetical protein